MSKAFLVGSSAVVFALAVATTSPAHAATFSDVLVQPPVLAAPERGAVAGAFAHLAFEPGSLDRGDVSLAVPIGLPSERGAPLVQALPSYSPGSAQSEWGMGWRAEIAIRRFAITGDLDPAGDEFVSPWGRLVHGSDGRYRPLGAAPQLALQRVNGGWVATQSDGTTLTFAAADSVAGGYAWMLSRVDNLLGEATVFSYERNASGRPFVTAMEWGGRGSVRQYRLELGYDSAAVAIDDFRAGSKLTLDRRVRDVIVKVRSATGTFETRWSYRLDYTASPAGAAFYLTGVTRTFGSGAVEPTQRFDYDFGDTTIATATLTDVPALDPVLSTLGGSALQPDRAVAFDAEDDGLVDFEVAKDQTLVRQQGGGFTIEPLPANPAGLGLCRPPVLSANLPRVLARMTPDAAPQVFRAVNNGVVGTTRVLVCDRQGVAQSDQTISGLWALGPTVHLVDLNHDRRPDLVRLFSRGYQVVENTSDATGHHFVVHPVGTLADAFVPGSSWVQDMNGDGQADLVMRGSSSIAVWYGLGQFKFNPELRSLSLKTSVGTVVDLTQRQLTFVDVNRDGLMDVITTRGRLMSLFVNDGRQLNEVVVPGLGAVSWDFGAPVVADVTGSGNNEVLFVQDAHAKRLTLSTASTGLLVGAHDGKGTDVRFTYKRSAPAVGLGARIAVLDTLTVESSGYDPVTYRYDYGAPVVHTVGKHLVGFTSVDKHAPIASEHVEFHNDDDVAGLALVSESTDERTTGLVRFTRRLYEDQVLHEVRWLRPTRVETGYRSADRSVELSTVTRYTAYERGFCPTVVTTTTPSGTLVTSTTLASVAGLPDDLHCLASSQGLTGSHADASRNFVYTVLLDRNDLGRVTHASQFAPPFGSLVLQDVSYDAEHRVATLTTPGRGTTTFGHDPAGRLTSVTDPLGVVTRADTIDPVTDQLGALSTARPDAPSTAFFRYDNRERLAASWDDVTGATPTRPLTAFSYRDPTSTTPGRIDSQALADAVTGVTRQTATLVAADGEPMVSATWLGDHYTLGLTSVGFRNTLTERSSFVGTLSDAALGGLTSAELRALGTPLGEVVHAGFGHAVEATTTQQAGVVGTVTSELTFGDGELVTLVHQPGGFTAESAVDAAGKLVRKTDELGVTHRYSYDALGRLVRADTPDGGHSLGFDGFGRPARISRAGLGAITYAYDPTTGLPTRKQRLDATGAVVDTHDTSYDAVGRPVRVADTTPSAAGDGDITYGYDGQLDSVGPPTEPGQLGRLTRVRGDGWQRTQRFDPLGRATQYRYSLDGWRDLTCDKSYRADGSIATDTTTITDATGATRLVTTKQTTLDAAGRVASLRVNGATLYTVSYDAEGRLARADFATGEALIFDHDAVTHHPRGYRVEAPNVTGGIHWDRDPRGLVAAETFDRGPTTTRRDYTYDGRGALIRAASPTDPADLATYSYTPSGLPSTITDLAGTRTIHPGPLGGGTTTAGPASGGDALTASLGTSSRLAIGGSTSTRGHRAIGGAQPGDAFVATGDRTSNATAIAAPPEDDPGPLTVGDTTYTFDAAGRVVTKAPWTFTYGASGQLLRASRPGRQLDYTYDDADQRLLKRVDGVPVRADLAGGILTEDHFIELVTIGGVVVGLLDNGQFTVLLTDPRGTPFAAPDGSPGLATPFGVRATPLPVSDVIDFARLARDPDLDLIRMGVRDYDPKLGQFLTPDPLYFEDLDKCQSSPIQCSLYGYAAGNPISFVDPTGMGVWSRIWGGAKAVGGVVEAGAGAFLVGIGAATSEVGVGLPLIALGGMIGTHGLDTAQAGLREAATGEPTDTETSRLMQARGVSRERANQYDAGLSAIGTFGGAGARATVLRVSAEAAGAQVAADAAGGAGGATSAIGATGRVGEEALRALGGRSQAFFRTSYGGRFVDQLVGNIAHESKVGYTALTPSISIQIAKDAQMLATRAIDGAIWHFFQSPVTGLGGPSAPLRQALDQAGIGIVIH
jgi:RHS repeat-associated protein